MDLSKIKVVLADDHSIVRGGLKRLINKDEVHVIAEASNGEEALNSVEKCFPDLLITDISMPDISGIKLAEIVSAKYPKTKVLILSMHNEEDYVIQGYEAGAMGYLLKTTTSNQLNDAIKMIHSGQKYLSPQVSEILASSMINDKSDAQHKYNLTRREQEVLEMLVEGKSNKQIASDLFVSIRTIDTHRTNIMKKLNVKNAADLVRLCIAENICG